MNYRLATSLDLVVLDKDLEWLLYLKRDARGRGMYIGPSPLLEWMMQQLNADACHQDRTQHEV